MFLTLNVSNQKYLKIYEKHPILINLESQNKYNSMNEFEKPTMKELLNTLPQVGTVTWIGIRPAKLSTLEEVESVAVNTEEGLVGDYYNSKGEKKRQVTFIQAEHLEAVASMLGKEEVSPTLTRRNIVVKGLNLLALKDKIFYVGDVKLEMTGLCHPCSRMEANLGEGGYNAMRGHGGITARVVEGGNIRLGDSIGMVE